MIETPRLKNFVIFIQTILSFVLSRKAYILMLAKDIRALFVSFLSNSLREMKYVVSYF